ncbi:DUF6168 family protein [Seonamhaeicola sp. ML3]|uniref:DUF6168 family protein n=1 Tax=Seonamhaeicola sp. ML3 TaxID=2937786 RepID=UPI003530CD30
MSKTLLIYLIVFVTLFFSANYLHQYILDGSSSVIRFDLKPVYIFFSLFSLFICVVFQFLRLVKKAKDQLGFIYLGTLVLKMIFFSIVFKKEVLDLPDLTKIESINLLIPLFIFLFVEVYFIAKILQQKK